MITVKFLIQKSSDTEMTILCQDGGLTFIEYIKAFVINRNIRK